MKKNHGILFKTCVAAVALSASLGLAATPRVKSLKRTPLEKQSPTPKSTPQPAPQPEPRYQPAPQQPYPGAYPPAAPVVPPPGPLFPPPQQAQDSDSMQGLSNFYASTGAAGSQENYQQNPPEGEKLIGDTTYHIYTHGLIGWGPAKLSHFLLSGHYRYTQDWGTDQAQINYFYEDWFRTRSAESFLFPTRSMVRSHDFTFDAKYVGPANTFIGLYANYGLVRSGSKLLGSKQEREQSTTLKIYENFVPYVEISAGNWYRGTIAIPFRTEINHEDEWLNNASYSWTSSGRGRLFSFLLKNRFFFQDLGSTFYLDVFWRESKYYSVQNDRTRYGISSALDFPIYMDLHAGPKATYFQDNYAIHRIRIPKTGDTGESKLDAEKIDRVDSTFGIGVVAYYNLFRRHKFFVDFSMENTDSAIAEFNRIAYQTRVGYSYFFPNTVRIEKRVNRFTESLYPEMY